jgi:RNA polymerase sigma-54 factor
MSQAQWLMKALDQRATTIMKVAIALVEEQQAFFEKGVAHLKPLALRQIADTIEMHESTVSRVTSNKYLACDRGVFELKYFFTNAIQSSDGGVDASAEAVRQRLKALIDAEEPLKPLSDDKLVELLKKDGHDLARRTVTKYREAMGIPSSFDRRRRALVRAA